jgi:hypothetical protein
MAKMAKKEERGFSYKKRSAETLKERANMKGGNFDTFVKPKFKQWKPKEGKNLIRILPPTWEPDDAPWQETEHYGLDVFVNYNIGADNQVYLSLSKHLKGEDPLAEAKREAQQEGEKEFAKKLNPTQRILYWIIDRNDEDEGPLYWAAPFTFDKSLSNLCIDEDTKEVIFIDDPAKGRDVRFYKEGTGLNTKYDSSKMKVLGPSSVHEDEGIEEEWLEFITENPLPSILNFYDYDHIKASFDGQIGKFDDDDDDEPPVKGKRKPAGKQHVASRRHDPEDEPDDDDEVPPPRKRRPEPEADEEDEVEAEKPRSRRRAVTEDDNEVTKPVKRRRVADAEEDEQDESPPTKSRRGRTEPEDEGDDGEDPSEGRRGSLREKLAARRRSRNSEDD